ncbi:MAG: hypothetical protein C4B58_14910 [Deltaproteobacteria bacterium]|nr:MAG: hypothetical protein C4B58_14910 [Deltaproteobacteria bacterium]
MKRLQNGEAKFADHKQVEGWKAGGRPVREIRPSAFEVEDDAVADLCELRADIAQDSPQASAQVAQRIRQAIALLCKQPAMGRPGRVLVLRPKSFDVLSGNLTFYAASSIS